MLLFVFSGKVETMIYNTVTDVTLFHFC